MSVDAEELVRNEVALSRAREEAALRENKSLVTGLKVVRILGWLCAFIPVIGLFGIAFLAGLIPFVGFAYVGISGAKKFAFKQIAVTIGGAVVAVIVSLIFSISVFAAFG